ncbi:SLC13 family permease [Nodosilinea sp. AN01ver1]|uniref:SLC13 family permease n=1 Tax=Nodosilinea sp. AN01ver1 TaxID=3423362 RepID=UPI003D315203
MQIRQIRQWRLTFKPNSYGLWIALAGVGLAVVALGHLNPDASLGLSWQGWLTLATIALTFGANALTNLPAEIVFLGGLAVLLITGILDADTALAGFSNAGMVTVGVLYVVVAGLQQTGGLTWVSQQVLGLPKSQKRAMVRLMVPVMGLSAVLNNTPVVAMFIPVVGDWCRKLKINPSKLMIPLSYASIFGGVCTLIGTSTNLVVNGLLIDATGSGIGLLDIAWVGVPCAIAAFIFLLLTQRWLLPNRKSAFNTSDDPRQYTLEMCVPAGSPMAGKTVEQAGLRHLPGLYLAEIVRGPQVIPAVGPKEVLRDDDQLVFVGAIDSIVDLHRLRGLQPATDQVFKLDTPRLGRCLTEAVVSDTCPLVGKTVREGEFRTRYNAVVLAVARNGERLRGKIGDIRLRTGDALLLEANPVFEAQYRSSKDFYLVSTVPDSTPINHDKAPIALFTMLGMIVLASFGWMSMLHAAILAAVVMVATGCCSPHKALASIEWSVLLVIAASLGLGQAMDSTGVATAMADVLLGPADSNPWVALVLVYGATTLLTEIVTNNAAAALIFPVAIALAKSLGVDFMPFVIAIMVGASASFATPIGYQTNLMVYGPGGYRFTDFLRVGIPINLLFWLITVVVTPLAFPF